MRGAPGAAEAPQGRAGDRPRRRMPGWLPAACLPRDAGQGRPCRATLQMSAWKVPEASGGSLVNQMST